MNSVLDFESGEFESHCSQHVVVSLGKTLHPKLLLWLMSTVLNACKSLWIKESHKFLPNCAALPITPKHLLPPYLSFTPISPHLHPSLQPLGDSTYNPDLLSAKSASLPPLHPSLLILNDNRVQNRPWVGTALTFGLNL